MKILGVDSAWNSKNPSGIALVQKMEKWECVFCRSQSDFRLQEILCQHPDIKLIVADIPLVFQGEFYGRRVADDAISHTFGKFKCSTHTASSKCHPNLKRISGELIETAKEFEIPIIETYPHPAILALFEKAGTPLPERLQYKVGKQHSYWPQHTPEKRKVALLNNLSMLREKLSTLIDLSQIPYPMVDVQMKKKELKELEDCLDALVCAWVGIQYLQGKCYDFGDNKSKIWIPQYKSLVR